MALIGTIREKFGVMLAVIIGIALFGFLMSSALNDNFNVFKGNKTTMAKIDGEKIDASDYYAKINDNLTRYSAFNNGKAPDEATNQSVREQTWNEVVSQSLLQKKYDALGITVTTDEMKQQCGGNNPHQVIKQQFSDPKTGQYNPANVAQFLNSNYKENKNNEQQVWHYIEKYIAEDRIKQKFNTLIRKGMYVPKWQAEMEYADRMNKNDFEYVSVPLSSIADDKVKPTDDELKDYLNKHAATYKNDEEQRKIEYVVFELAASSADSQKVYKELTSLVDGFKASTNDSSFVYQNSEEGIDGSFLTKQKLAPSIADTLFKKGVHSVVGPYLDNGFMKLAKIVDRKMMPDSVKARHILIKVEKGQDTTAANRKIDSLWTKIKKGADFGMMALQYSDDGSKTKMGDLGFFSQGMMVPEFNDACFNGKKGDIIKVKTQFGVHLIQITDQKGSNPTAKVFYISKSLHPSKATEQNIFNAANSFAGNNNTAALFDTAVIKNKMNKRVGDPIRQSDNTIPGFANARDIVKWAYTAKLGEVSIAFNHDEKLIVCKVAEIREAGLPPLESVRSRIEGLVRNEKKADMIMKDVATKTAGKTSLKEIGAAIGDTIHTVVDASFSNPFVPMLGFEPAVLGYVAAGKYTAAPSKPIKGNQGVFFIQNTKATPAPPAADYASQKATLLQQYTGNIEQGFIDGLKKQVKIKDYRSDFF